MIQVYPPLLQDQRSKETTGEGSGKHGERRKQEGNDIRRKKLQEGRRKGEEKRMRKLMRGQEKESGWIRGNKRKGN